MTGDVQPAVLPDEAAALRRVEQLKARGIWTGYRRQGDGWVLLHDPDLAVTR